MSAYYNEFDPKAAAWLRELIAEGLIAPGEVDERDIRDVKPDELRPFRQVHLFAGIGGWSAALRKAGWSDDRPVWTASCPCQPFSAAGGRGGFADERHLWPVVFRLIEACRPPIVLGEQVASSIAVGREPTPNVLQLWEQQANLRLLQDWLEADATEHLQGLPKQGGSRMVGSAALLNGHAREQAACRCESPSDGEGAGVRSGHCLGAGAAGCGALRSDGFAVRHGGATGLEHTFNRPEEAGGGLHESELAAGLVRVERGLRELGRSEPVEGSEPYSRRAAAEIERALARVGRELEEQNGQAWLDSLRLDMEGIDYSGGTCVAASCGFGAPNLRQRLYFVWLGDTSSERAGRDTGTAPGAQESLSGTRSANGRGRDASVVAGAVSRLADAVRAGRAERRAIARSGSTAGGGASCGLADPNGRNARAEGLQRGRQHGLWPQDPGDSRSLFSGALHGFWRDADWVLCRDDDGPAWRPVEPGAFPLAPSIPGRVALLRGAGNAINLEVAAGFIEAVMDVCAIPESLAA